VTRLFEEAHPGRGNKNNSRTDELVNSCSHPDVVLCCMNIDDKKEKGGAEMTTLLLTDPGCTAPGPSAKS